MRIAATAAAFLLLAAPAAAQEAAASAPLAADATPKAVAPEPTKAEVPAGASEAKQPPTLSKESAAPAAAGNLDFDLLPATNANNQDPTLDSKLRLRRSLLIAHQALGITTVALLTTAVVFGQLNYDDRFGGGQSTGQYEVWHSSFATASAITFLSAGTLALLAPVPIAKRGEFDTITIHKWSMLVATLCYAAEIPLGIYTVSQEGHANQADLALAHLILGYVTLTAVAVGTAALFFN